MVLLTWIIINPDQHLGRFSSSLWNIGEIILLIITLALTIISAHKYYTAFIIAFMEQRQKEGHVIDSEIVESDLDVN